MGDQSHVTLEQDPRNNTHYAAAEAVPQPHHLHQHAHPHNAAPQGQRPPTLDDSRARLAHFFYDLRMRLQLTPEQAAYHLATHPQVVLALETGHFGHLPPWPEVVRIVHTYVGFVQIDGRPLLEALAAVQQADLRQRHGTLLAHVSGEGDDHAAGPSTGERLRRARSMIAENAMRLPREAYVHARELPARTFYAVSLPLALLILVLNSSLLQMALSHLPGPLSHAASAVTSLWSGSSGAGEHWVDVEDPRARRSDKLPVNGQ
ncbi:MAG: hypothetical protein ACRCS9_08000 [Hyphomicrobium sp.]